MKNVILIILILLMMFLITSQYVNATSEGFEMPALPSTEIGPYYVVVLSHYSGGYDRYTFISSEYPLCYGDNGMGGIGIVNVNYPIIIEKWTVSEQYPAKFNYSETETYYEVASLYNIYPADSIVLANYAIGTYVPPKIVRNINLSNGQKSSSFLPIQFEYEGFLGSVKVKLGKEKTVGGGSYDEIREWQYPPGQGTVIIPVEQVPYAQSGNYQITIYDNDTEVQTINYNVDIPDETINEIVAPYDNASIEYYPNIQLRLQNKTPVNLKINGKVVKRIASTAGKLITEIIAYEAGGSLLQLGVNLVELVDDGGNILDSNEFIITREGTEITETDDTGMVAVMKRAVVSVYETVTSLSNVTMILQRLFEFLPAEVVTGIIALFSITLLFAIIKIVRG